MIELEGLSKNFGEVEAVKDLTFSIDKGEVVAFLGPNGAGKTTAMRMLTGFLPPTRGRCLIKGVDVVAEPITIKKWIGYLPEDNPLYPDMKVYEYLEFISKIRKIANFKKRIEEISEICGIDDVLTKDIGTLSKGYRQRVGVAQAIIHNPDILILDEPTEGLDPTQVLELRRLIKELGKEKTVMLSTHILSEAEAMCERVIIINKGRVVADGPKSEIDSISKGGVIVLLELLSENEPAPVLKWLSEIKDIKKLGTEEKVFEAKGKKRFSYRYEITADRDIREQLFNFAVKNRWIIRDMHRKVASLEDVFRELIKAQDDSNNP